MGHRYANTVVCALDARSAVVHHSASPPCDHRFAEQSCHCPRRVVGYLIINIGIGNFLEPLILGRRVGVSTLVIVLAVFFWGWMWGPLGMFLAVPLTMVVKVIFDNSDDFRWLSVAMGKGDVDEERILAEQKAADKRRRHRRIQN